MSNQPLTGVKVIDLTYFVAGPGAGRLLADWGADVIKVEPAFGDPGRTTGQTMCMPTTEECNPFYSIYNSNKKGLSVNLKTEKGKEVMNRLLKNANVFLTSYRTGALIRLGLDYETLSVKFPHLIWAQITGFGTEGPAKNNPGFDTVAFWARSGAMMDIIEKGSTPVNPPIGFGDATTSCSLAAGICAALYEQQKSGYGQKVMVSLYGQGIWSMGAVIAASQYGDEYPKTRKNAVSPVINSFRCKDGKWLFVSILEHDRYYNILMDQVLERKDLVDDPRYATAKEGKKRGPELIHIIEEEFAKHTEDEMIRRLEAADIAYERIWHALDVAEDEQALTNHFLQETENRDGSIVRLPQSPVKFNDINPVMKYDAPLVGQDTYEILREAGYSTEEIRNMIASGIAVCPK
ncbi:MAG: CoA transferase [Clostridiales bacterium]|nr:CoA transferase [Clostridiales bacterium]